MYRKSSISQLGVVNDVVVHPATGCAFTSPHPTVGMRIMAKIGTEQPFAMLARTRSSSQLASDSV